MYKQIALIFIVCCSFIACERDVNPVPFPYPEGLIYFPAAELEDIYTINTLNSDDLPGATPGVGTHKYIADVAANVFEIPLSVYRSGVEPGGDVSVSITMDNDTLEIMKSTGTLADTVQVLDPAKCSIPASVDLKSGERTVPFSLKVDFDYLFENAPTQYACCLEIAGAPANPELSSLVVLIDTKMLIPTPGFTTDIDAMNKKTIYFLNESENITKCMWNFGDGNTSTEMSPVHTYADDGKYKVELTVVGLYGNEVLMSDSIAVDDK